MYDDGASDINYVSDDDEDMDLDEDSENSDRETRKWIPDVEILRPIQRYKEHCNIRVGVQYWRVYALV